MSIKLLDCTLRDGGHQNKSYFEEKTINNLIQGLVESHIEFIEVGFLREGNVGTNIAADNNIISFEKRFPIIKDNQHTVFTVMIQQDQYDINMLPPCSGAIKDIRVSFHDYDIEEGLEYCRNVISKGYNCYVNPINITGYNEGELIRIINEVNFMGAYAFTIVDTFGSLMPSDLKRLYTIADQNLNKDIVIGLHLHDNLKMAFALAQLAVEMTSDARNIIIDGSLLGMGREPGNLCIELMMDYINKQQVGRYDVDLALDMIDSYILKFKQKYPWGYETAYALSAQYKVHRSYAEFLFKKHRLRVKQIRQLLGMIPRDKQTRYDESFIEELYKNQLVVDIDDSEFRVKIREVIGSRKVLLVAPGKTLSGFSERIIQFHKEENPVVISANFKYSEIDEDYIFCSNVRRLEQLGDYKHIDRLILSPLLKEDGYEDANYVNTYKLGWFDNVFWDNCMLMLLHLLKDIGITTFYLAGWDGFSTEENFVDPQMELAYSYENENEKVKSILKDYFGNLKLIFITPSKYEGENE